VGEAMRADLEGEIGRLKAAGITPGLAAVLVGDNPASTTYVRMKGKACDEAGLYHETIRLKPDTAEAELLKLIDLLNEHDDVQNVFANFEVSDALVAKMGG